MAAKPLVYVHGAGPQQPAAAFKHEADMILFGRDMPTTKVAHYSDVRWPPAGSGPTAAPNRAARPAGSPRSARRWRRRSAPRGGRCDRLGDPDVAASPRDGRGRSHAAAVRRPMWRPRGAWSRSSTARRTGSRAVRSAGPPGRGPRSDLPGPDLPLHRRQVRERRHRLPVRPVHGGDAGAGPPGAPAQPAPEGHRRPQPRHDHHLRRAVGAGLRRASRSTSSSRSAARSASATSSSACATAPAGRTRSRSR